MIQELLYGYGWIMVIFRGRVCARRTRKMLKHGWSGAMREFPREAWAAKGPGLWETFWLVCNSCLGQGSGRKTQMDSLLVSDSPLNYSRFWGKTHTFPGAQFPAPRKPLAILLRVYFEMYRLFIIILFWREWAIHDFEITSCNDFSLHENSLGFISSAT